MPNEELPTTLDAAAPSAQPEVPPAEAVEAFRKLQEQRPAAGMSVSMAMGTMPNPIQQKVNEGHITLVLETAKQTGQNDFELKKQQQKNDFWQAVSDRVFELILLLVFVGVIVFSINTFKNQPTILTPILTGVGGLFTGLLAGIGYGKGKGKQT